MVKYHTKKEKRIAYITLTNSPNRHVRERHPYLCGELNLALPTLQVRRSHTTTELYYPTLTKRSMGQFFQNMFFGLITSLRKYLDILYYSDPVMCSKVFKNKVENLLPTHLYTQSIGQFTKTSRKRKYGTCKLAIID